MNPPTLSTTPLAAQNSTASTLPATANASTHQRNLGLTPISDDSLIARIIPAQSQPNIRRTSSATQLTHIKPLQETEAFDAKRIGGTDQLFYGLNHEAVLDWMSGEGVFGQGNEAFASPQEQRSEQHTILRANLIMRLQDNVPQSLRDDNKKLFCCWLPISSPQEVPALFSQLDQLIDRAIDKADGNSLFTHAFRLGLDNILSLLDGADDQCKRITEELYVDSDDESVDDYTNTLAALNQQGATGRSVAHYAAAWTDDIDRLCRLEDLGVDFAARTNSSPTGALPIEYAFNLGNFKVMQKLLESFPEQINDISNAVNKEGYTLAHYAVATDDPELLELVINAGGLINEPENTGVTPLMAALGSQNSKIAIQLIKAGADLNTQTSNGATPAHLAVAHRLLDVLKEISLKGGSYLDIQTKVDTPMALAIEMNQHQAVKLLARKVNLTRFSNTGLSYAHLAVHKGSKNALRAIASERPEYITIRAEGSTPLELAQSLKMREMADCIKNLLSITRH